VFLVALVLFSKKKGFVSYNGGLQINSGLISAFLQNRPMSVVRRA
jgi:hypothetical protein